MELSQLEAAIKERWRGVKILRIRDSQVFRRKWEAPPHGLSKLGISKRSLQ
jgi:hypothetical protein